MLAVDVAVQLVQCFVEQEDVVKLVGEGARQLRLRAQRLVGSFEFEVQVAVRHCVCI